MTWHPETLTDPSQAKTSASTNTEAPWEPLKGLSPTHIEMIKQHVKGISISRIVLNFKRYGVNYSSRHISRVLQSQQGKEYASLYSAHFHGGTVDMVETGRDHMPEAVYTELDLMRNPLVGERHRLGAAQDLMDRFGPPKISRQETEQRQPTTVVINLLPSQLSQFLLPPPMIEAETVQLLVEPAASDD